MFEKSLESSRFRIIEIASFTISNPDCVRVKIFSALLVNVIHGRSVAYSERVVAHLKAPASVGPIFCYITDRLVIKINQFFHMNVTSQNILIEISAKFGCDNRSASFSGLTKSN